MDLNTLVFFYANMEVWRKRAIGERGFTKKESSGIFGTFDEG